MANCIYAQAITPSDTLLLPGATTGGIWVGGTGTLTVTTVGGTKVEFQAIPAGTLIPIVATQVWSTGTSATLLVSLWGPIS